MAAVPMIFNFSTGALGVGTLLGLLLLITGPGLVLIAFIKKNPAEKVRHKISDLKAAKDHL